MGLLGGGMFEYLLVCIVFGVDVPVWRMENIHLIVIFLLFLASHRFRNVFIILETLYLLIFVGTSLNYGMC